MRSGYLRRLPRRCPQHAPGLRASRGGSPRLVSTGPSDRLRHRVSRAPTSPRRHTRRRRSPAPVHSARPPGWGDTARHSCAQLWSGSNATDRAPSGSACGAKTMGRNAFMRGTVSTSSANTSSWSATTPTASSSPADQRGGARRKSTQRAPSPASHAPAHPAAWAITLRAGNLASFEERRAPSQRTRR